jgi:hypothetical protein
MTDLSFQGEQRKGRAAREDDNPLQVVEKLIAFELE